MLAYYITIPIDDDFGVQNQLSSFYSSTNTIVLGSKCNVDGIKNLLGNSAEVDPEVISCKNFWKPVERFLKNGKKINEIDNEEFVSLFSDFGNYELEEKRSMRFDKDNDYDLAQIRHDVDRISFNYRNCPVYSFYLIQLDDVVKIILGPYTKDYFVMEESQWLRFVNHLKGDIQENRELKLNEVLGESPEVYTNIIRQLKFLDKTGKTDSFQSSVLDFYDKKGYITEKQAKVIKEKL
jgi:hypothetical protein